MDCEERIHADTQYANKKESLMQADWTSCALANINHHQPVYLNHISTDCEECVHADTRHANKKETLMQADWTSGALVNINHHQPVNLNNI